MITGVRAYLVVDSISDPPSVEIGPTRPVYIVIFNPFAFYDGMSACFNSGLDSGITYGYDCSSSPSTTWYGPGYGPNADDLSAGCSDSPVFAQEVDLSSYVNGGSTLAIGLLNLSAYNGDDSTDYLDIQATGHVVIEVDYSPADPDFWTNFNNSHETIDGVDLEKDSLYVYVPEVAAQPYLPPSFDCYPPPPAPPPIVDPPGGGNGSGPPSGNPGGGTGDGCYYANVYQQWISCCGLPPDDPFACGTCSVQTVLVGTVLVCP
jgi:hypothetical protein